MSLPSVFWVGLQFLWTGLLSVKRGTAAVTVWESCHEIVFVMWTTVSEVLISLFFRLPADPLEEIAENSPQTAANSAAELLKQGAGQ